MEVNKIKYTYKSSNSCDQRRYSQNFINKLLKIFITSRPKNLKFISAFLKQILLRVNVSYQKNYK